jgi:toxin ParE1/3/4
MNVEWSTRALTDLRNLRAYIARENRVAADKEAAKILAAVEQLRQFPHSGKAGRKPGTRELVISGTPYILVYSLSEQIEIATIFHTSQAWPDEL